MKSRSVSCLSLFFLLIPSFCLFAEIHGTQTISGVYYHVDGDKSRSFYPGNETDYLYEGAINFTKETFAGYSAFGDLEYRVTDDRTVDLQDASVERMYIGFKKQAQEILLGDFYSNFSEYTLGNSLKGLKVSIGDEKSSRLLLVSGIDTSKWEDLWEKRQEDSSTRRYVWGARLENSLLSNKLNLNFNYGGARDDKSYVSSSVSPILVNVFGMDARYALGQYLSLFGEIANSFTDEDTRKDEEKTKNDYALKGGFDLNLKDYNLTTLYSRVGNHFNTTGGFSAQDLETLNFDGIWFMPLKVKFTHYLHMDRDNLSKTKTTTTKQLNPGGKFAFKLPLDFNFDLGADMRKRFSVDKTTNGKTYTYTSSLARDFGLAYGTLRYTKAVVSDKVSAAQERDSDTVSLALDGSFTFKDVRFSWNAGEDIVHDYYKEAGKSDMLLATNLGMKAVFPSTLTFQLRTTLADNDFYIHSSDSNNADYYFSVSRELRKDLTFDVSYQHKSYRYFGGDNNYAENFVRSSLSYKF